jgi:hypothetical protein
MFKMSSLVKWAINRPYQYLTIIKRPGIHLHYRLPPYFVLDFRMISVEDLGQSYILEEFVKPPEQIEVPALFSSRLVFVRRWCQRVRPYPTEHRESEF